MRVGLNLLYLLPGVVGGTETYAAGLLSGFRSIRSKHEFVLFVNQQSAGWIEAFPGFDAVICSVDATKRSQRYLFEQFRLPQLLKKHRISILHSLGYTSPLRLDCPSVVTVHDLNFKAFGRSMSIGRRLALNFFVRQAILRCEKVITVSEFSRQEICRQCGLCGDKVTVIPEAATLDLTEPNKSMKSDKTSAPMEVPQPYFIAFSSSSPNKNIPRMVRAYKQLRNAGKLTHRLVLVGHRFPTKENGEYFDESEVIQTGYVDQEQLKCLLAGADFLVFPSFYEGFGLPVLEAMAAGVPVTCSRAASLPEVAGDAALYFDPFSEEEIAQSIEAMAGSRTLREELKHKGLLNARRYSWNETAKRTLAIYEQAFSQYTK